RDLIRRGPGMDVRGHNSQSGEEGEFTSRVNVGMREGFMRPELLNRIDEVVVFHQLGRENLTGIVDIQLQRLRGRLADRGLLLELSAESKAQIASEGWDPAYGARPLKRVIQQRIENPLASRMLAGEFGTGDTIRVDYQGKSFVFEKHAAVGL
ncbi:MAG: hypothetical protein H7210_07100, partial [Pyrinomonadaceae bacterium]|nr:hypothetical protein [Phycisphaerales bacterium]